MRTLNLRLAEAADADVLLVDRDRVASDFGKRRSFDDRYWHLAKQAVALDALPDLAWHTVAVLAASEGLGSEAVVVDADNTLWGGVVAEDGLAGFQLGDSPQGAAFVAFQEYLLALRSRGILLAVVSKNDDSGRAGALRAASRYASVPVGRRRVHRKLAGQGDEREPGLGRLNIGLDSLVFVEDDPAERDVIRQILPEVEVIPLPPHPGRLRAGSLAVVALRGGVVHVRGSRTVRVLPRPGLGGESRGGDGFA